MNILRIVRNNFKRSYNRRTGFVMNLLLPIIVVILGILANNVSKPSFTIGIINGDQSPDVVASLAKTDGISVRNTNPDTIQIDLITGKFSAVISFSDFNYSLFSIKDDKTNNQLKQIIHNYQETSKSIKLTEMIGTDMSMAERTIGFIVLFLMVTATMTASNMIKDKNNGTLKRYLYSPQTAISYILGNFFYNYMITFLQFYISITFMQLLGIDMSIGYGNWILTGIWLSGIATAFGTFFSSIFQNEMYATLFATFIALILSLIGGSFIAYENMPAMLQKLSIISPLHWFIDITKNMVDGINWFENVSQVAILSVMILMLLTGASLISLKHRTF